MSNGWIGVDLDGTLAHYGTWQGIEHIGPPIPSMVTRVKHWLAEGQEVKIFTARVARLFSSNHEEMMEGYRAAQVIQAWCEEHIGEALTVTCMKDFAMKELWDDRAVRVEFNTGRVL